MQSIRVNESVSMSDSLSEVSTEKIALLPSPPNYFLGYHLPIGHPCNSFTLPPPPADKKRTGPRRKFYILLPNVSCRNLDYLILDSMQCNRLPCAYELSLHIFVVCDDIWWTWDNFRLFIGYSGSVILNKLSCVFILQHAQYVTFLWKKLLHGCQH